MKNIHVLPTDKLSRLFLNKINNKLLLDSDIYSDLKKIFPSSNYQHIYITSTEEIKEGDWFIANNGVHKCIRVAENTSCPFITLNSKGEEIGHFKTWRTKTILTTDQDLIKDGVQKIDDDFLEWFVNNPSCEDVDVKPMLSNNGRVFYGYKIIIPKEEHISDEAKQRAKNYMSLKGALDSQYVDFSNPNSDKITSASTTTIKEEPKQLHYFNWKSDIINEVWDKDEEHKQCEHDIIVKYGVVECQNCGMEHNEILAENLNKKPPLHRLLRQFWSRI